MDTTENDRLTRIHVSTVRANGKGGFVVVLSDPEVTRDGKRVASPDTWEVSWDQWVASGARAETL